jgi:hypothetical protein
MAMNTYVQDILKKKEFFIASIDIGDVNYSYSVEKFYGENINDLRDAYQNNIYNKRISKQEFAQRMEVITNDLYKSCERYDFERFSARERAAGRSFLTTKTRRSLLDFLESKKDVWDVVDAFYIEAQYINNFKNNKFQKFPNKGNVECNVTALKLAEVTTTFFLLNYPKKLVQFIPADSKFYDLGCPKKMAKYDRKKWSVENAQRVCEIQGDDEMAEYIKSNKIGSQRRRKGEPEKEKMDDVCDSKNQAIAAVLRYFIKASLSYDDDEERRVSRPKPKSKYVRDNTSQYKSNLKNNDERRSKSKGKSRSKIVHVEEEDEDPEFDDNDIDEDNEENNDDERENEEGDDDDDYDV